MPDEPTLGEVMRRLDALVDTIANLAREMRDDRQHAATTFVRLDVYREARKADRAEVSEVDSEVEALKADKKRNEDFRRQASLAAAVAALGILGSFGLAIFNLIAGGAS